MSLMPKVHLSLQHDVKLYVQLLLTVKKFCSICAICNAKNCKKRFLYLNLVLQLSNILYLNTFDTTFNAVYWSLLTHIYVMVTTVIIKLLLSFYCLQKKRVHSKFGNSR